MANGGKDVRLGDDKRPVSVIPKNEDQLFNIANGEILTDEFGTPLITQVDQFFLADATAKRSTSIVFPEFATDAYSRELFSTVNTSVVTYGANLEVGLGSTNILLSGGSTVGFGTTVSIINNHNGLNYVSLLGELVVTGLGTVRRAPSYPFVDVKTISQHGSDKLNKLYYPDNVIKSAGIQKHDKVYGAGIPDGTYVVDVFPSRLDLSNNAAVGIKTEAVRIDRAVITKLKADNVFKIEEQFKETSEVSTTLLGIPRAETQLSLFSNVSSYGLNNDEFEFFTFNGGNSFGSWDKRANKIYGNRYNASRKEEVQESAIRLEAFPVPYSYPFSPKFARLGYYNADFFNRYLRFIQLGNRLYQYFDGKAGYPSDWKDNFLDPTKVYVSGGDVEYAAGITDSFALIDTWTDVWRKISTSQLINPTDSTAFTFPVINTLGLEGSPYDSGETRPGYSDGDRRYSFLQSRRVFRYQPGRISGFTFGLRSSIEPVSGITLEWGIKNPTDQYVFQIEAGQLKIIRRSTIPLPASALARSGLTPLDQERKGSGDPFDDREYWTIEIPRDKFNGDPLTGNGPSGYTIQPDKVTMYKIEFGWYGAIGARFYAYIPVGNGDARWVVVHTLVIENSVGSPCLEDSFFRLVYALNVAKTSDIFTPQFLYKYGASYYIDGGDEGTSTIFSASSRVKSINPVNERTLIGITPKDFILNSIGTPIKNKKLIIPIKLNITSDSLAQVKVVKCRACPGFGHVYSPGIAATTTGPEMTVRFTGSNQLTATGSRNFFPSDVGSKVIAPTFWDAYIAELSGSVGVGGSFDTAIIKGYGVTNGYPTKASKTYDTEVFDPVLGISTSNIISSSEDYRYPIRLSNQNNHYATSEFKFTGSKIEIQFLNPDNRDEYNHFADFTVGMTNYPPVPDITPGKFVGFTKPGTGTVTVLEESDVLFAEHTHAVASMNEDGVETGESFPGLQPPRRMAIDYRIPKPSGDASGLCSKAVVEVLPTSLISGLNQVDFVPNASNSGPVDGNFYIFKQGTFPTGIDYDGGQIKLETEQNPSSAKYVGTVKQYTDADNNIYQYIQISDTLGSPGTDFSVEIRPVKISATGNPIRQKLFNFDPYPLFFFAKFSDKAALNNLTIKEISGDFQRTITPQLRTLGDNVEVTTVGGKAPNDGAPPTNFEEISRLSSAIVDVQNTQQLRPGSSVDTVFIGADQSETIDMSKIFGQDRNVITPDNQNIEATFLVAKKLDSGASGEIEATLNYKEQ